MMEAWEDFGIYYVIKIKEFNWYRFITRVIKQSCLCD